MNGRQKGLPTLLLEAAQVELGGFVVGKFFGWLGKTLINPSVSASGTAVFESSAGGAARLVPNGNAFARKANAYLKWLPEELREVTIAVTEINRIEHVAINGTADPTAIKLLGDFVRSKGGKFYVDQGIESAAGHAERVLYNNLRNEADLVIGISRKAGMCDSCTSFFKELPNVTVVKYK